MRLRLIAAFILASPLLVSCAGPPVSFIGDGQANGLVVVDTTFTHAVFFVNQRYQADQGSIAALPVIDDRIAGMPFDHFLVFPDVPPGTYLPRQFRAWTSLLSNSQKLDAYLPLTEVPDYLRVPVGPGEIAYIGRLFVQDGTGNVSRKRAFRYVPDPVRERRAWQKILDDAPQNPWAGKIQERLDELDGKAPATASVSEPASTESPSPLP